MGAGKQDMINSPSHYTFSKRFEVIDVLEDWNLDFHLGNVVKYIVRNKHKGNELEDLKKAQWYLNRKVKNIEKIKDNNKTKNIDIEARLYNANRFR